MYVVGYGMVHRPPSKNASALEYTMTHQSSPPQRFQVGYEAVKLFHVALPSVLIQLSLYWIFPVSGACTRCSLSVRSSAVCPVFLPAAFFTLLAICAFLSIISQHVTASSVGRNLGSVDLAGFSLACMVGNLTCLSIMEGSLTAADTLMPRAFGAQHYNEVARIAVRAVVVGGLILVIPIVPLCFLLRHVLVALGQDEQASELAQTWIRVYFVGALPNLGFRVLMRFLLAQQKPWPLVVTCGFPALVLHPFLIANWVPSMGLVGSAWSIVAVQWTALISLLVYLHFHPAFVPETWPGLSMTLLQKSLQTRPTWQFFRLAVGGILSMNEWWFFEIMCFIARSFGVVSLDAHTVAYNMLPLLAMFPLGVSIGLAVRMGLVFADEPERAKAMARWCVGFIAVVGALVSLGMHVFRYPIIRMFTNDKGTFETVSHSDPRYFQSHLIYPVGTKHRCFHHGAANLACSLYLYLFDVHHDDQLCNLSGSGYAMEGSSCHFRQSLRFYAPPGCVFYHGETRRLDGTVGCSTQVLYGSECNTCFGIFMSGLEQPRRPDQETAATDRRRKEQCRNSSVRKYPLDHCVIGEGF